MIVSVASGKGGTGKTTIAVNLALSIQNVQFLDCDVEEPNAHLFLKPLISATKRATILVPQIDEALCTYCGKCRQVCAYHAIAVVPKREDRKGSALVFSQLCHGCGACSLLCPQGAIKEVAREMGVIKIGDRAGMQYVYGRLNIGEAMSPPLIRQVKEYINPTRTVIIDAPPGTSCPVVTAVKGSDFCILVTEPTPFGLNDLILAVQVLRKIKIPFGVIINRADIGDDKVESYCAAESIPILLKIPFDRKIAEVYSKGELLVEAMPEYVQKFKEVFEQIK